MTPRKEIPGFWFAFSSFYHSQEVEGMVVLEGAPPGNNEHETQQRHKNCRASLSYCDGCTCGREYHRFGKEECPKDEPGHLDVEVNECYCSVVLLREDRV